MTVELSIHNVVKIEQGEVIKFDDHGKEVFFVRDLIIINEKGEEVGLTLYAWDEKSLKIREG